MTPSARLAAAAAFLDGLDWSAQPEPQLRAWARANRYAGAKDRRAIADRVYDVIRHARSLRAGTDGSGRALVLASLARIDGLAPEAIAALCSGDRHALAPLSAAEAGALAAAPVWEDEAERLDWPAWLWPEAARSLGEAIAGELDALRRRAPVDLRANLLRTDRAGARRALAEEGIATEPVALADTALRAAPHAPIARSRAYRDGLVELQDAGSQAATLLSGAAPGMTVLDYCAGGGGKTLALAAMMDGRGRLAAHDAEPRRMRDLPERAARAGLGALEILRDPRALRDLAGRCDLVMVDAPCSGSGSWRRDPMGKWRLTPERLGALQAAQDAALDAAAAFVRPGGALLYVTCSVLCCENEDRIAAFLERRPDFAPDKRVSLRPARDGCDGFGAARLRRGARRRVD